jgi:outer membrane protein assembly factor BamB
MYRGDTARTGVFPGPAPSGPPIFLWRYKIGNSPATPGVGDGIVVAQGEAGVAAVDQTTDEERWLIPAPSTVALPIRISASAFRRSK